MTLSWAADCDGNAGLLFLTGFYTRCWTAGHHFIGLRHFHCIKDNFINFDCIKVNLEYKIPKRVVNGQPLRKLHQSIK